MIEAESGLSPDLIPLLAYSDGVVDPAWSSYGDPLLPIQSSSRIGNLKRTLYTVLTELEQSSATCETGAGQESVRLAALGSTKGVLKYSADMPVLLEKEESGTGEQLLYGTWKPEETTAMVQRHLNLSEASKEYASARTAYVIGQSLGLLYHPMSFLCDDDTIYRELSSGIATVKHELAEGDASRALTTPREILYK